MATRTQDVTKIHPITQRTEDVVMAWIFTLTLREGDRQAMDTVTVPVDPAPINPAPLDTVEPRKPLAAWMIRKPLAAWTRTEVDALVAAALATHPKIAALHRTLDTRLAIHERMDFDIDSMPS